MQHDLVHTVGQWQDLLIVMGYALISLQFFRRARNNSKAGRAFFLLMAIFSLCAVNGYVMHAVDSYIAQMVRLATMTPLIIVTYIYVWRSMVVDIADAIDRDSDQLQKIIDKAKSAERQS